MADRMVARRYASAFMELLQAKGGVDAALSDLAGASDLLMSEGGELFRVLCNPIFTVDERRAVLVDVLSRTAFRPLTTNLLRLLLDKRRMEQLPLIVEECAAVADDLADRVRVRVDAAEPLTPQLEAEVRVTLERVTGKRVLLETHVDPDLIAGIVARVGGRVYDASLRTRLQDLKVRLINAQAVPQA